MHQILLLRAGIGLPVTIGEWIQVPQQEFGRCCLHTWHFITGYRVLWTFSRGAFQVLCALTEKLFKTNTKYSSIFHLLKVGKGKFQNWRANVGQLRLRKQVQAARPEKTCEGKQCPTAQQQLAFNSYYAAVQCRPTYEKAARILVRRTQASTL